jgi:hypothetical protein
MADLTIDDLLAWGRDYEQLLKDPASGFSVPRPMLDQYIAAANAALAQQMSCASSLCRSKAPTKSNCT